MTSWVASQIGHVTLILAALIPSVVIFRNWRYFKLNPPIALYIMYSIIVAVVSVALAKLYYALHISNHSLLHTVAITQIILIGWFYYISLRRKFFKYFTLITLSFFLVDYVSYTYFDFEITPLFRILDDASYGMVFILLSFFWYYELMIDQPTEKLLSYPPFYFVTAFFFYFATGFFIFTWYSRSNFPGDSVFMQNLPKFIHNFFNLILNSLIAIGIWKELKQTST